MDLINQHNAWLASILGVCLSFCGLIITAIVNFEKLIAAIKKFIWGIVILFPLAGLFTFFNFGGLTYLKKCGHSFVNWMSMAVPLWGILLTVCLAFVVAFGVRWIFRVIDKLLKQDGKQADTTASPQEVVSPQVLQSGDYRDDLIDGVWWQWTYSGNQVNTPRPICPDRNCQCDLAFREDYNRIKDGPNVFHIGAPPVTLHCQRCGFRRDFDKTENEVLNSIGTEIVRLLRTGQFRDRLARRAVNR